MMLIKAGVCIRRLKRWARKGLHFCDTVYASFGLELVVTSTFEGTHGAGSLHYCDQAFDLRLPPADIKEELVAKLKRVLGDDFDVIIEKTHIHVEYDPKGNNDA